MSFINTKEPLKVGEEYQYKEGLTGFGDDIIANVVLIEDRSDDKDWKFVFKILQASEDCSDWLNEEGLLESEMLKGDFYFSGMPRIWDKDEYDYEVEWDPLSNSKVKE